MKTFTATTAYGELEFTQDHNNMTVMNLSTGERLLDGEVDSRIFDEEDHAEMVAEFVESFYGDADE